MMAAKKTGIVFLTSLMIVAIMMMSFNYRPVTGLTITDKRRDERRPTISLDHGDNGAVSVNTDVGAGVDAEVQTNLQHTLYQGFELDGLFGRLGRTSFDRYTWYTFPKTTLRSRSAPIDRLHDSASDLVAASALGLHQFGDGGREDLVNCVNQGTPGGLTGSASCVGTAAGRTVPAIKSLVNLILEQFLGIFTTKTIEEILEVLDHNLGGLVPSDEHEFLTIVHKSLLSVSASLTGNAVTAIENAEECILKAYETSSPIACLISPTGGVQKTLEVLLDGVIEQMIGTIPTSILGQFTTIVRFHLANTPLSSLADQLTQSIHSLVAQLVPGTVTGIEKLQTNLDQILSDYSVVLSSVPLSGLPVLT
ncbi:hypothetical protein PSTG_05798 [Puccinia striiformis f. sp. tritici PST-78]|uniref:Uncharacterized protein n=1 Tax=Puccinia striiformis f. sp. tritici PST-78 TaxID=1165861 RepID=A0A0L0VPG9_9BASI|nr:hypothetical protein PSTG_05798 [Puccinia striiformis f. sp. tritici PST-78]